MASKEQIRKKRNELLTTGKLKDVKDLPTLFENLPSWTAFQEKVRKQQSGSEQLVFVPHMKIVPEYFRKLGETPTKIKLKEPCALEENERKMEKEVYRKAYETGIEKLTRVLTKKPEKTKDWRMKGKVVSEKRTCYSNHKFPWHLVQWRYINAQGRKYRCDNILLKKNPYVCVFSSNGEYFEIREFNPIGGWFARKFTNIGFSLQSCYDGKQQYVCGDSVGIAVMFYDGNSMALDVKNCFSKAQTQIQVFYRSTSEAIRFDPIREEVCFSFLDDDWAIWKPVSKANSNYIAFWGDMTDAERGVAG